MTNQFPEFREILETVSPDQIWPAQVSTTDRDLIDQYFHFRRIGDDDVERFCWFFKRNLSRTYPRYLLDLDLELSKIPELVDYRRAGHVHVTTTTSGTETGKDTGATTNDTTRNNTRTPALQRDETHGGTTSVNDSNSNVRAYSDAADTSRQETGKKTDTYNTTDETTRTGKDITNGTDSSTVTTVGETGANETVARTSSGSEVGADVTSEARKNIRSGSEDHATGAKTTTDTSDQVTPGYSKHIEKALPMSSQYGTSGGGNGANDAYGMPALNFQYASGQAMDETSGGKKSGTRTEQAHTDTTTYKNITDDGNTAGTRSSTRDTTGKEDTIRNATGTNNETVTDEKTNNSTVDRSGTDTAKKTGTVTADTTTNVTGSDVKAGNETTQAAGQTVTAHGETVSISETGSDITDETSTASGTSTMSRENTRNSKDENKTDSMESGQSVIETEIREKFRRYVENSQSILWLRDQLEICFLGVL